MSEQDSPQQWYVARDGQQHGPLSQTEMELFVKGGHLKPSDLIWRPGFADWKPAIAVFPPQSPLEATAPEGDSQPQASTAETTTGQANKDTPEKTKAATEKTPDSTLEPSPEASEAAGNASEKPATYQDTETPDDQATSKPTTEENTIPVDKAKTLASALGANKAAPAPSSSSQSASGPASRQTAPTNKAHDPFDPKAWQAAEERQKTTYPQNTAPTGQTQQRNPEQTTPHRNQTLAQTGPASGQHRPEQMTGQLQPHGARPAGQASGPASQGANIQHQPMHNGGQLGHDFEDLRDTPRIAMPPQDQPYDAYEHTEGRAGWGRVAGIITGLVVLSGLGYVAYDNRETISDVFAATAGTPGIASGSETDAGPPVVRAEPIKVRTNDIGLRTAALDNTTGTGGSSAATTTPQPPVPVDPLVALDEDFEKSELWSLIKKEFPDWYQERLKEVAEISANKSETDVSSHLINRLVSLRRSNANHALAASPQKLERVAVAFLANLQSLTQHSTDACFRFISQGESNPTIIKLFANEPYGPKIEAQIAAIFEAIADGRRTPISRARAEKPDYDQLASELGKLGWGQDDLKLFADPTALSKATPDRVCKMVQDWFQAHISISDKSVQERLLFETLRPVVAG